MRLVAGHVKTTAPPCQVSMPGLDEAHHYIIRHGKRMAEAAAKSSNLLLQVGQ
jgi:hypothetical protein